MRRIGVMILGLFLLLSALSTVYTGTAEGSLSTHEKGHSRLFGHSQKEDSSFKMALESRYWYPDLILYLGTTENRSNYSIRLNGEVVRNGSIAQGFTKLNITLNPGELNHVIVEIDQYKYEYRQLVASGSVEAGWTGPQDTEGNFVSDSELLLNKLRTFGITLVFTLLAIPPAIYFARRTLEKQIVKVID